MLTALWLAPAVLGLLVLLSGGFGAAVPRRLALAGSIAILAYALWLIVPFSEGTGAFRLTEVGAVQGYGIRYALGLDGLSLSLVWLNAFLVVAALLGSWAGAWSAGYWASFLFLEAAVMGVFLSRDLFWFYVFWEIGLIPMFFLIGLWGSEGRRHAALKFLLYTVSGSIFMLVGFLALVTLNHRVTGVWTWDLGALANAPIEGPVAAWIYLAIALGFAVKVPLFPLHNWLPDAHTEAPAGGSVILAGVLLKMGVYGFLRVLLPVLPQTSHDAAPILLAFGVVNILYGGFCAASQTDFKRLIAYSSISHLGFCMVGIASLTPQGILGGSLQMLNHGLSTGALFLMIGMLYERAHRRGVSDFGGLALRAPRLAFFFAFVTLSSIGLPGLNGFIGETLSLAGAAVVSPVAAALGLFGTVLAAWYLLPAYQKVFWAPEQAHSASAKVFDLDLRERGVLWAFCALILWIGLAPGTLLGLLEVAR